MAYLIWPKMEYIWNPKLPFNLKTNENTRSLARSSQLTLYNNTFYMERTPKKILVSQIRFHYDMLYYTPENSIEGTLLYKLVSAEELVSDPIDKLRPLALTRGTASL